jgi:ankyrin repeat protein
MAVAFDHEAVVRALIEAGADVNKPDNDGSTPLSRATEGFKEAIAQLLRDAGAA